RKVENLYVYSHLKNDQDTGNNTYQAMNNRAMTLATNAAAATSWFDPELLTLPEEKLEKYFEDNKDLELYRHAIQNITANRDHVLSAEMEGLLAEAGDVLDGSQQTFAILNNADIEFPTVTNEDGEEVQLSHGLYGQLLESKKRDVRQEAVEALYEVYGGVKKALGGTLQTNGKKNNYLGIRHKYKSAKHR